MSGPEAVVSSKWEVGKSGVINVSTRQRQNTYSVPTDFKLNALLGSTPQVTFQPDLTTRWNFVTDAYWQKLIQIRDSVTGLPYPPGAAVALNPDYPSLLAQSAILRWGSQTISQVPQYLGQGIFVSDIGEYSWDYANGQQGQQDAFILDGVGQTQFSVEANSSTTAQLIANDTTSGAVLALVANSATVLGLKALSGTITAGDNVTLSIRSNDGSVVPVYAVSNATAVTAFTVGTVSGTTAPLVIAASGNTATDAVTFYAGGQALSLYDITTTKAIVLTTLATSTAATSTITIGVGSVGTITTGDAVAFSPNLYNNFNANQSGFWKRQALTDAGKYYALEIPVKRPFPIFKTYTEGLYGQVLTIQFNMTPQQIANMVQVGPGLNPASIYVVDWQLVIPTEEPGSAISQQLAEWLHSGAEKFFTYEPTWTTQAPVIQAGNNSYNQTIQVPADPTDWLVIQFVPQSYFGNSNANIQCSLVPAPNPQTGNPLTQAYLTYQGQNFPVNSTIGNHPSDIVYLYNTFKDWCGRRETNLMSGCITFQQWLTNYFFLVFDLRGRSDQLVSQNTNTTLALQFYNTFAVNTYPIITCYSRRPASFRGVNNTMVYRSLNGTV